ncbi:O-antigen ligase family protein [Simiduia sp. 21SJ11W-1]|uniref:O-antigen ligase family protein n=1 Tax=Simiduia sp. 21SJ11W-1 TaxID=2909669 RepID=UPI00209CD5C2|nr:O-antigen ligase family protein [Simiduia sp. 21SJ11W-1]UTA47369.1 O-antigen ligase family protein [Simiduia sp. 21SJ11W-1]
MELRSIAGLEVQGFNRNEEESRFFVVLTGVYIFTWYLQLGSRISILDTIRFEFLLGLFLSIVSLFRLMTGRMAATPLRAPVVTWIVLLGLYTLFSIDVNKSWDVFFNRVIKFSMMALFISVFVKTKFGLTVVLSAFLLAMLKLGQEGMFGWLGGGLVWQNQGIMRLHGSTLMYRHPNSFSGMAVGCLPFIFYLFPVVNNIRRLILLGLLCSCLVIIVFTGSRTGYVATVFLAAYFWRDQIRKSFGKAVLVLALVILTVPFVMPEQYKERFHSIFTMEEAEGASASTRLEILEDAWAVFLENPMGVGVSAFPTVRMEMFGRFQDTHNLYLEILTNTSIFGALAFGFWLLRIVSLNRKVISESDDELIKAIAKATIAFVYARLFLGAFGMDAYEIYWWFATGLTVAVYKIASGNRNQLS